MVNLAGMSRVSPGIGEWGEWVSVLQTVWRWSQSKAKLSP
jgi:hypothetical protein